jgi:hypothetical protein
VWSGRRGGREVTPPKHIKNITTQIPVEKTIMELEGILSSFGASMILKEYEGSRVKALSFMVEYGGVKMPFKMPMKVDKARALIEREANAGRLGKRYASEPLRTEQAMRVGWRLLKDWVSSHLSLLEIEYATPIELFLPWAWDDITKKTLYETLEEKGFSGLALEDKQ